MPQYAVFRVDFGRHIGLGHLMRCLALAAELKNRGLDIVWIARKPRKPLHDWVHYMPGTVWFLPGEECMSAREPRWRADAEQTTRLLQTRRIQPRWLIVDHYALDKRWHHLVRPYARAILHITDFIGPPLDCDMLLLPVNTVSTDDAKLCVPHHCQVFFGSQNALLHRQFAARRPASLRRRFRQQKAVRNVLVNFGGYDAANGTLLALRALAASGYTGQVHVVLREHAPFLSDVQHFTNRSLPQAVLHTNVSNIAPLAADADLALGAGGTSAWERCCLGLPAIIVTTAANQHHVAHTLHQRDAAHYVGSHKRVTVSAVTRAIHAFLQQPDKVRYTAKQAASVCDGLGAKRLALRMMPFTSRNGLPVTLRPMQPDDCRLVYTWQCHPATRRYARNPTIPTYSQHKRWFHRRLRDAKTIFHMIEHGAQPVGVLRLDQLNTRPTYEVSIHVSPQAARRGIGLAALHATRALLPHAVFHAVIKQENKASRQLFMRAGYNEHDTLFTSYPQKIKNEEGYIP